MRKEDIIALPHVSLRQRSKKVGIVGQQVLQVIDGMKAATMDWEASRDHEVGVALAAVQVNQLYRIVVIRQDFNDKQNRQFSVFINPEIAKYEGVIEHDYEGCLSVKDVYGKVPRHSKVRVKALDEAGKPVRVTAEGFLARVFQHEIDHTNGILFVDRIKDDRDAFYQLQKDGKLKPLDYDEHIRNNHILW